MCVAHTNHDLNGAGSTITPSRHGLLTTLAHQLGPAATPCYALEGSVAVAGLGISWLRDNLRIIDSTGECEDIAASVRALALCVFQGRPERLWKWFVSVVGGGQGRRALAACRAWLPPEGTLACSRVAWPACTCGPATWRDAVLCSTSGARHWRRLLCACLWGPAGTTLGRGRARRPVGHDWCVAGRRISTLLGRVPACLARVCCLCRGSCSLLAATPGWQNPPAWHLAQPSPRAATWCAPCSRPSASRRARCWRP